MNKNEELTFDKPNGIYLKMRRWQLEITIVDQQEKTHKLIASADGALTEHDGIWVGTPKEMEEALDY